MLYSMHDYIFITGKNDGSVKGKRYFQVKPNHGIFVRSSGVSVLAPGIVAYVMHLSMLGYSR